MKGGGRYEAGYRHRENDDPRAYRDQSMTISEINELGEDLRLNNPYSIHNKIEIIVSDEKADVVVKTILDNASTRLADDGVISVATLDYAVKIRTEERLK